MHLIQPYVNSPSTQIDPKWSNEPQFGLQTIAGPHIYIQANTASMQQNTHIKSFYCSAYHAQIQIIFLLGNDGLHNEPTRNQLPLPPPLESKAIPVFVMWRPGRVCETLPAAGAVWSLGSKCLSSNCVRFKSVGVVMESSALSCWQNGTPPPTWLLTPAIISSGSSGAPLEHHAGGGKGRLFHWPSLHWWNNWKSMMLNSSHCLISNLP